MRVVRTTGKSAAQAAQLLAQLEKRGGARLDSVLPTVRHIVRDVKKRGDAALLNYAAEFDGLKQPDMLQISREEMAGAWEATPVPLRKAIEVAAANIRAFAERQLPQSWSFRPQPGLIVGQQIRALGAVGCYVPSGRYPLPSTLLMTVIPAQVSGVKRIVVVSPRPAVATLAAAHLLGIDEFYRIGGAQAVAALAYGTKYIAKVDKIVGPGNLYVTAAKKLVAFDCSIDMLAGPTEALIAGNHGTAAGIAGDLVAQAEHDPEALPLFVTTNVTLARAVAAETKRRAAKNPIAKQSIAANGIIFVARDEAEMRAITNRLAAEHLTVDTAADAEWVESAGSIFVGEWSSQPMGDYVSGPNHTLPTGQMARIRGGLSVLDYIKVITVQQYTKTGIGKLGPAAIKLAEAEGLYGHAEAIRARGVK
jgi:histidinol dehydrogenase